MDTWIFDEKDPKYFNTSNPLSGQTVESTGNMVSYCSYSRCGNSFLRKYLEKITGIATGSDMVLEYSGDCLQMPYFKAEEITDPTVWVYKSHNPQILPNSKLAKCNKVICTVRNPYDIIVSWLHFTGTMS